MRRTFVCQNVHDSSLVKRNPNWKKHVKELLSDV
jgi:hypothetical protein